MIINPQFMGSRQTHRKRRLHRVDLHEDHGELCIEDPRERRSHLVTSYGPVGLWWTTHASSERSWCWWRSPPCLNPPSGMAPERAPNGISRRQKLVAAEKYFWWSPDFFGIFREFRGRPEGPQACGPRPPPGRGVGACGAPGAPLPWLPSSPIFFRSKKNLFGDFLPFGLRFKISSKRGHKHGKKQELTLGTELIS